MGATRAGLLDVRDDLFVDVDARGDDDDRRPFLEQCDRAVLHLTRRVPLGRDVRDLFQLQGTFERDRQPDVPAEVEEERFVVEALRDVLDRVVGVEEALHLRRQVVQLVEDELDFFFRERVAALGELQADQEEQCDLRGEGLGGCDSDLEAGARVEHGIDLTRDLRAHHVRDRNRARTLFARELHRLDRVARLA